MQTKSKLKLALTELTLLTVFGLFIVIACSNSETVTPTTNDDVVVAVDPTLFLASGLTESITKVTRTLSDGSSVECYKIVTNNTPSDHAMGPWCPTNINDDASKGGIWASNGKLYDVDGAFVKNLATFYNDAVWKLYNSDGTIKVTNSKASCEAAARPDVDPAYNNYCVECQPSYVTGIKKTFYIPVKPVKLSSAATANGMGVVIGIAFNGVNFDPPAPVSAILGAHTLAPFDDAGGHVNTHSGYHYHAATGKSKTVAQSDGHAAMIGYVIDGYGLFENLDPSTGKAYTDLDASGGHYDSKRGYHYHANAAGSNSFINSFRGAQGSMTISL
ncbi:YHYH protein [Arcicella aquatica]|uniref:YHYH protein n=1 Tax=Arcicella aquatica TaxID=217141 RepID=A0ABU5QHP4_9BACT|nr:YHYH protein [Arcicella aquatica]MEA5256573.1 YHYH protein [Arcicella aquatica]